MLTLVYQAYGGPQTLTQTLFSVLTFLHPATTLSRPYQIVVYTDKPAYFEQFGLRCELLTPDRIKEWRGPHNFVHRLKIKALQHCRSTYGGDLLYLDGDTYFAASPAELLRSITPQESVMHVCEGTLSRRVHPRLHEFLQKNTVDFKGRKDLTIPSSTEMWNAGVVGLSEQNAHLLDDVLELTDALYLRYYDRSVVEQFAFSYVLRSQTNLVSAEPTIHHYWEYKDEMGEILDEFFVSTRDLRLSERAERAFNLRPVVSQRRKQSLSESVQNWFRRQLNSVKKKAEHLSISLANTRHRRRD